MAKVSRLSTLMIISYSLILTEPFPLALFLVTLGTILTSLLMGTITFNSMAQLWELKIALLLLVFFRIQSPGNALFQPHTWLRYIDDIFTAFTSTIKAINTSFLDVILFTQYGQILLKNATRNRQRLFAYLLYSTTLDTNKSKRVPFMTTYNPSLSSPTSPKNTTIYLFLLAVARQLFSIFFSAAFRRSPSLITQLILISHSLSVQFSLRKKTVTCLYIFYGRTNYVFYSTGKIYAQLTPT